MNSLDGNRGDEVRNLKTHLIFHVVINDDANEKIKSVTGIALTTGFETVALVGEGQVGSSLLKIWDTKGVSSRDHAIPVLELLCLTTNAELHMSEQRV